DPNTKDDDRLNDGRGGHAGKFYGIWDFSKAQLMQEAIANPESWLLPAEFNEIAHERGILSMARSRDPHSAGSQFFICVDAAPQLDKKYTAFGKVIKGLEVIDQIVAVETPRKKDPKYRQPDGDNPLEPVWMKIKIVNAQELELE
ncbi:MAG: peptidylprolyl isomerase, partial [Fidelibacterota bacterium]